MKREFESHFNKEFCAFNHQTILVALSGGADSMVLLYLLKSIGVKVLAAHCNFHLRGEESNRDEQFVRHWCDEWNVSLQVKQFDTKAFAEENKLSIEMAARDLRYAWFHQLIEEGKANILATGHHRDDSVETFFLNLLRGTGIKGLTGIKAVSESVIRPLLIFSRKQIEDFCQKEQIAYVTDSSNLETVYMRNKIRNQILPLFTQINPSFQQTMMNNMDILSQCEEWVSHSMNDIKDRIVIEEENQMLISLRHIHELQSPKLVLFELLSPMGFNGSQVDEMNTCIRQSASGKQFFSPSHRLIIDRFNLIVLPLSEQLNETEYYIEKGEQQINAPLTIDVKYIDDVENYSIIKEANVAQFDADLLEYPLTIRKWKQGDQFRPLGMKQFKKLSDFFIDNKFSIKQKEDTWLLLSGNDIIWIIGNRTDDRYKISHKTKLIAVFTLSR